MNNDSDAKHKYLVTGVEDVYDSSDEFEHSNSLSPIEVEASSLEEAITSAERLFQAQINRERFKSGFVSSLNSSGGPHGMYFAKVEEVSDSAGKILYKEMR